MQQKPGRNDPCYCGSGKKYKKCHMASDKEAAKKQRQLADAGRWLRRDFLRFAREERFAEAFAAGLPLYWNNYYTIDNAEEMSQNEAFRFFDWLVFDFQYQEQPRLITVYRDERQGDLSVDQQQVLDLWLGAPPAAAYTLIDYEGQNLQIRDFVTGEEFTVYEPAGKGLADPEDLLLGRLVRIQDRLEFSTIAAYIPQDEIADLAEKLETARKADSEAHADSSYSDFMQRRGYLIIHHALEQAELKGRPPVSGSDPNRSDGLARKAAQRLRKLQS
jgi:hypothetical protein